MSHNKMYREIEGYEESMYLSSKIIDETDELIEMIRYGENYLNVIEQIEKIAELTDKVKYTIRTGEGKKI